MPMPPRVPHPHAGGQRPHLRTRGPRTGAPRTATVLLIATLMLLSLVSGTALAAGGPPGGGGPGDDGVGPGGPGPGPRVMDVDVEPHRAQVRAQVRNGQDGDEIGYDLEAQNQLQVKLRYGSKGDSTQNNLRMTVTFQQVIEFDDSDGDGELGPGDEVVSTYDLEGAEFGRLQHQTRKTLDGKDEEVITGATSDGVFAVVCHFVETQARIQSGEIAPNWMKLDILIEDYPYQRTTTRLALRTQLEAQGPVSVIHDPEQRSYMGDGEGALECNQEGVVSFYSWMRQASVVGADSPVRARVSAEEGGTYLYLSYQRGDSINHDPKLGLPIFTGSIDDGTFDLMASLLPYIAAIAVGAVAIGAAVTARRRRNGVK